MVLGGRLVVPRQNNDELPLGSCCVISVITVKLITVSSNIPTTTSNPVNAGEHILPPCVTFPPGLKGDNCWSEDVKTEMVQSVF